MKTCSRCGEQKGLADFVLAQRRFDEKREGDGRRSICKVCHNAANRAWRASMTPADRQKAKERHHAHVRRYKRGHPMAVKAGAANLRAKRLGTTGRLSAADVDAAWNRFGGKCWVCGFAADELDHFRPINNGAGGTNTPDNIRPICKECNQKRSHGWHGDYIANEEAVLLRQIKVLLHEKKEG